MAYFEKVVDFNPNTMQRATPEDIVRIFCQLYGNTTILVGGVIKMEWPRTHKHALPAYKTMEEFDAQWNRNK